jgi:hypothetical protein
MNEILTLASQNHSGAAALMRERLRPPVQLADPPVRVQARCAISSFNLSILADVDSNQPGCATDPETFALPIALHHHRVRGQGRHAPSLAGLGGRGLVGGTTSTPLPARGGSPVPFGQARAVPARTGVIPQSSDASAGQWR